MSQELLIAETEAADISRERRSMVVRATRKTTLPVMTAAIVLVAWEIFVDVSGIRAAVLPAPSSVLHAAWANRDVLIANAMPTAVETIGGFLFWVLLGGPLCVPLPVFCLI